MPTIEIVDSGDSQRGRVGIISFPNVPETQAMRKAVKLSSPDIKAIAFWAKSNQVGRKVQIGARTKNLAIYTAGAPLIEDEWQRFVIPLSDLKSREISESAEAIQPEEIVSLIFSIWNSDDAVSGDREPLELYLDEIEFLLNN